MTLESIYCVSEYASCTFRGDSVASNLPSVRQERTKTNNRPPVNPILYSGCVYDLIVGIYFYFAVLATRRMLGSEEEEEEFAELKQVIISLCKLHRWE